MSIFDPTTPDTVEALVGVRTEQLSGSTLLGSIAGKTAGIATATGIGIANFVADAAEKTASFIKAAADTANNIGKKILDAVISGMKAIGSFVSAAAKKSLELAVQLFNATKALATTIACITSKSLSEEFMLFCIAFEA